MKKLLFHPLTVVLATFVCLLLWLSLDKTAKKTQISNQNIQSLEFEIKQLEQEIASNKNELYQLEQDFAKEKIVRDQLLRQKDGEIIVQLPIEKQSTAPKNSQQTNTPWQEWLQLFKWRWE